jgi:hypothetical protein
MDQQALGAAFDMEGGFNDVVLSLARGASRDEVIDRLDRILEPYGNRGVLPRDLQLSHWMVENELNQLQNFGFMLSATATARLAGITSNGRSSSAAPASSWACCSAPRSAPC